MSSNSPTIYARASVKAAPRMTAQQAGGLGPWQAIELIAERIFARLAAVEARKPVAGEPGAPGKDGRGIAKAVMDAAGDFILFYSDGTTENLGRVHGKDGKDGKSFESAEFDAMRAELAQMRQAVNDSTSLNTQLVAARVELEAVVTALLARIDALQAEMPAAWLLDDTGELSAVYRNGEQKKIGRVRGKDGSPGAKGESGLPGVNGKDGRPGVDGLNGKDGIAGLNGKDGAAGLNGKDGVDGKDGAPGKDGVDGKDGAPGADGEDGATVEDVQINQHGHLEIRMTDRRRMDAGPAAGAPGAPGAPGKDGTPGKDAQPLPDLAELIAAVLAKLKPQKQTRENRDAAQAILDGGKPWEAENISRATYYRRRRQPKE